ncbi:hypothetical protein [Novosphingobium sp.]|nr:hypothetical protein [Novosphingobium sp.]
MAANNDKSDWLVLVKDDVRGELAEWLSLGRMLPFESTDAP